MGQVLHGSATPTEAVRRANQHRQASLRALSKRYGIHPKTVAKSKKRISIADPRTGPKDPRSTVLSPEDEAIVVAFRRHTLLPLDASLYALQATILLTRSSLRRCLQRHGISRCPKSAATSPSGRASRPTRSVTSTSIWPRSTRRKGGSTYLSPSTVRPSPPSSSCTRRRSGNVASAASIIKVAIEAGETFRAHSFESACARNDIDHRLTKPRPPWTNGQVERMNRTIKDAAVKDAALEKLILKEAASRDF